MTAAAAFLVRDVRVAWSYRFSLVVRVVSLVFSLLSLRFASKLFTPGVSEDLAAYGGDYFTFALVGTAISLLSYPIVKSFASAIRSAQVTGTLEAMLTTRTGVLGIVLGAGVFPILMACIEALLLIAAAAALMHAQLRLENLAMATLVLLMTVTALAGFGLMSAGFVVVFKQNEPFSGALIALSFLLSGILYPTSVLPPLLRDVALLLPITHAVELSRGLLLAGASPGSLAPHFLALGAFCLTLPVGVALLSLSFRHARRTGSLAQY